MKEAAPIREARRIEIIALLARAAFLLLAALIVLKLRPGNPWRLLGALLLPTLSVLALALVPWGQRALGRAHLATVLGLDVLIMSLHAMPPMFARRAEALDRLTIAGTALKQWWDVPLAEPFLLLLIPLVLLGWGYGRRGALWGSTWAVVLHLGSGFWLLQMDLLGQSYLSGELLRILLIYVVPLIVSTLAGRERQRLADLEVAHARLRRHAATVEQLAVSRERNRLARDLHDTLAHSLAALIVQLQALQTLLAYDPQAAKQAAQEALENARRGLADSRQAIQSLRADPLTATGLVGAVRSELQALEARSGIRAKLSVAGQEADLMEGEAQALFRIAEEALRNAERHSAAKQVHVRLAFGADRVDLTVQDDGIGFDPTHIPKDRYGLIGMRERAEMIGAELEIKSHPGQGTEIWCSLAR